MFEIHLASQPKKFLKKCDKILQDRIMQKLEDLKNDPVPHDAKFVVGRNEKTFRVRVGDYRILYCIYYEKNQILVSTIDKRSRVY